MPEAFSLPVLARKPLRVVVYALVLCHRDDVADHVDDVLSTAEDHLQIDCHAQQVGQVEVRDDPVAQRSLA